MEIIVGKYSGFCNGVRYTVESAKKNLEKYGKLYSLGEIVHNEVVMDRLDKLGLIVKDNIDDIPNGSRVIIRAHGEGISTFQKAKEKNLELIDLTCGRVKLVHNKILNHRENSFILIIGKKNHPETIAHNSYSKNSFIIENENDIMLAYNIFLQSKFDSVYIVSQTTFNGDLFDKLVDKIKQVFKDRNIEVDKTICNATNLRQEEVINISQAVDKMIIIGGNNSSNTKELYNIASKYCQDVILIQSYLDLNKEMFNNSMVIGIEAGASTPKEVISDVVDYLNSIYKKTK